MSQYDRIREFNKAFGVREIHEPRDDIFETEERLIDYRKSLVLEEVEEMLDSIKNKDLVELIDALTDINYVVLGFYTALGISADKAFDIVHQSNMSKLCKTEEEAKETVLYYEANKDKLGYDSPAYRKADDNINYVVYNRSTGKILKSINYHPATNELRKLCKIN